MTEPLVLSQSRTADDDLSLRPDDLISLAYNLKIVSIFHPQPLEVTVPGVGTITAGNGFGGFSWSIFQRGEGCTACGRCCFSCRRRTWWWHDSDPRPAGLKPQEILVNGTRIPMWYHMTTNGARFEKCDFLGPLNAPDGSQLHEEHGIPMWGCTLHDVQLKPVHCRMDPFLSVWNVTSKRGARNVLSRRLPSRNHLWPRCPIDLNLYPLTEAQAEQDWLNLHQLADSFQEIPGLRMRDALSLYYDTLVASLTGNPPQETIYFEDYFQ